MHTLMVPLTHAFESGNLRLDVVVAGDSWWTAEDCSGVFGDDGPRGR